MPDFTPQLLIDIFTIVLIDLLLAGDNAVVIAMAVKTLSPKERKLGITIGAAVAVVLRIGLTFVAAQLLLTPWIKLAGGTLVFWIAIKLLTDAEDQKMGRPAHNFWSAVWYIMVADLTMSLDNILAVAATSKGSFPLLLFGLGLSIPFVIFTSTLLSRIMDRFPIVVWIGAAILGRVGADMIITDPMVHQALQPSTAIEIAAQVAGAVLVVVAGRYLARRRAAL